MGTLDGVGEGTLDGFESLEIVGERVASVVGEGDDTKCTTFITVTVADISGVQ